jgi:hypothetical protein
MMWDIGRYILEEEVQQDKELTSLAEVRKTLTRFMVAVALSLEGLVGVFDAAVKDPTKLIYPVAVVLCAVVVMLGLGLYQRISVDVERSADSEAPLSAGTSSPVRRTFSASPATAAPAPHGADWRWRGRARYAGRASGRCSAHG